jgi:hypothetical protein
MKNMFKDISKKGWLIVGMIIVIGALISLSVALSSASRRHIPSDFTDARQLAAGYADDIVGAMQEADSSILEVQALEKQWKHQQALDIVTSEIARNRVTREKGVNLALQLGQMARNVPDIKPEEAAQQALVGISQETALISKLLEYNNDLQKLFTLVQDRIAQRSYDYAEVNALITTMNEEARSINDLNGKFREAMGKFDAVYEATK